MKWLVPASLVVLPILAACGDDEEAISDAPTTSPTGLNSGSSAPAFADATVTIRATATLGPTFGDAPELFGGFREFAPLLMYALASGDTGLSSIVQTGSLSPVKASSRQGRAAVWLPEKSVLGYRVLRGDLMPAVSFRMRTMP